MSPKTEIDRLPEFSLAASTGQTLKSDAFEGRTPLVLAFVPDVTSEAGRQTLRAFNERLPDFGSERTQLLGVAKQTARTLRQLADETGISFPILADADASLIRAYGADSVLNEGGTVVVVTNENRALHERLDPAPAEQLAESAVQAVRDL